MAYSTNSAGQSDEALLQMARDGDKAAFERLVKRYETRLFNYIRRVLGSVADAEDVFQLTFMRVYQHLNDFRMSALFRPWLYQIATNLCRDELRRRRRRPTTPLDAACGVDDVGTTLGERLPSPEPSPSAVASAHELAERLDQAIAKLPLKHRSVFVMAKYEDMPYEEIARTLEIPVGTVKSRMNKAVDIVLGHLRKDGL